MEFIDVDPSLNGSDYGQLVFDEYTQRLPRFDPRSMQVFTGIGYVFTQARQYLPFDMVPGTYHELYNPDPLHGPKTKLYLGKYAFENYFSTKEFTPYPPCNNIIICDWNQQSIQMILDILEAAPQAFIGKRITVVHGNILEPQTINVFRDISVKMQIPISAVYFTNIVNEFTPELVELFRPISPFDVTLICDMMDREKTQRMVHTMSSGGRRKSRKPKYRSKSRKAMRVKKRHRTR